MSDLIIPAAHRAGRNAVTMELLESGSGVACLALYSVKNGVLLGRRSLQTPPAHIDADGALRLLPDADAVDLFTASGQATWGALLSRAGDVVAEGTVTDSVGDGAFLLAGAAGTQVYAGGRVELVTPAVLG